MSGWQASSALPASVEGRKTLCLAETLPPHRHSLGIQVVELSRLLTTCLRRHHASPFLKRALVAFARATGATKAFIEGYAYGLKTSAHSLGELGGVVRLELVRAGLELVTVPMQTARKLLLGRCPKQGAKVAVAEALRAAGARFEGLDESDAFAVLNWGLSEVGGYCFALGYRNVWSDRQ